MSRHSPEVPAKAASAPKNQTAKKSRAPIDMGAAAKYTGANAGGSTASQQASMDSFGDFAAVSTNASSTAQPLAVQAQAFTPAPAQAGR